MTECRRKEPAKAAQKGEINMSDCIFCKIANGEIPSATLYEDEDFRVILDLGPANKGHALILPKQHYANLYEIPDELAGKAMVLAKKNNHQDERCSRLRWLQCCAEQRGSSRSDCLPLPYPSDSTQCWG